jgi:hypothetical protein
LFVFFRMILSEDLSVSVLVVAFLVVSVLGFCSVVYIKVIATGYL